MYNKEMRVSEFLDELEDANCRFVCGPFYIFFDADDKFAYTNISNKPYKYQGEQPYDINELSHIDYKGNIVFQYERGNPLPKGMSIYDREGKMIVTMTPTGMMSWITANK